MSVRLSHIKKLLGYREDSIHLHKIIGASGLIHYIYRFNQWKNNGKMSFTSDSNTFMLIIMHALLSFSSLIFHLPKIRNPVSPMIYPEFRAHSIIFAYRSIAIMLVHWCFLYAEFDILKYYVKSSVYKSLIVIATMSATDLATKYYMPQGSTMRNMPFPEWIPENIRRSWNIFYSICQVFATLECLMRYDMSHAFMVLFPIQIAAFLMTCARKNIITPFGWHVYYTLSLVTTITFSMTCEKSLSPKDLIMYKWFAILFCTLRFHYKISKYILWSSILITYNASRYYII